MAEYVTLLIACGIGFVVILFILFALRLLWHWGSYFRDKHE